MVTEWEGPCRRSQCPATWVTAARWRLIACDTQSRGLKTADDDHMERVRDLHKNIMNRVEQVQNQTGRILQGEGLRSSPWPPPVAPLFS